MILLTAEDVGKALPMDLAIEAMKRAYAALSNGQVVLPQRLPLTVKPHDGISLFMPAFVQDETEEAMALKVVSIFPRNQERDLPTLHAVVMVMEASTGRPVALLEGGSLTAIRTGAASGAATDLLARRDSRSVAVFGAGVQARTQLEAVCTVRSIEIARVYDPSHEKADKFISEMAGKGPIPMELRPAKTPQEAVSEADIICAATTSSTPVFEDIHIRPGVHVNGIGSYTPNMTEVSSETVKRSLVVVDSREAALEEAGDLIQPIEQGLITQEHIHAELGEIVLGLKPGRVSDTQITFFKSVGVAVQDVVAAQLALQNAQASGLGQKVYW